MRQKLLRALGFYFILTAAVVSGCAVQTAPVGPTAVAPTAPAEIKTADDAKQDLAALVGEPGHRYFLDFHNAFLVRHNLQHMLAGVPAGLNELETVDNNIAAESANITADGPPYDFGLTVPMFVVDELGIRLNKYLSLPYSDLLSLPVSVDTTDVKYPSVLLGNQVSIWFVDNPEGARRASRDLKFIRDSLVQQAARREADFEARAAKYREMAVKPTMSEEQRKYVVQANAMTQRKDYARAVDFYLKALDVDPVAYPGAYFNLALLSARMQRYKTAIGYMKQYLLLAPDAKDARSGQDKIYEWEGVIGK